MLNYKIYQNNQEEWLVLIHGIGGDMNTWDKQVKNFSEKYNLLLLDLPWHGKSVIKGKLNKNILNDEIKKIMDMENIKKSHFLGLSLGSLVISQFALKYPEYVDKMIFAGSVIQVTPFYKTLIELATTFTNVLPYTIIYNLAIDIIIPKKKANVDQNLFRSGFVKMSREHLMQWIKYLGVILDGEKVVEKLKKMHKKMIFISGEYDSIFLKGALQSAKIIAKPLNIMKKCCHVCNIDNPKLFNYNVLHLLAEPI